MSTLKLTDRNNELIANIPRKYVSIILNNIIAKSVDSGLFFKEASYVLDSTAMNNLEHLKKSENKSKLTGRQIIKKRIEDLEKQDDKALVFTGFD